MKLFLTLMVFTRAVMAEDVKKVPPILTIDNSTYHLCKEHTIRYAYVIKIAYVGLYLQNCSNNQNLLNVSDKLIRFNYQMDVKAEIFIDAAKEFFEKNTAQEQATQFTQELNRFNQFYENINDSDYYDLYHQSGETLKLYKNNKLLGTSENSDFAFKYFNIWFGEYPSVKPLKKALMG